MQSAPGTCRIGFIVELIFVRDCRMQSEPLFHLLIPNSHNHPHCEDVDFICHFTVKVSLIFLGSNADHDMDCNCCGIGHSCFPGCRTLVGCWRLAASASRQWYSFFVLIICCRNLRSITITLRIEAGVGTGIMVIRWFKSFHA